MTTEEKSQLKQLLVFLKPPNSLDNFDWKEILVIIIVCAPLFQLCLTLCEPVDWSLPGSAVHETLGKNTVVGCHALLQGIFPTQEDTWVSPVLQVNSLLLSHQVATDYWMFTAFRLLYNLLFSPSNYRYVILLLITL